MSSSQRATINTSVKIDISPEGIKFTLEGIDTDLARLIESAGGYTAQPVEYHTFDTSDVVIKSNKVISFVTPIV